MPLKKYKVETFEPNITIKSRPQYKCPKCGGCVRMVTKYDLPNGKEVFKCDKCGNEEVR